MTNEERGKERIWAIVTGILLSGICVYAAFQFGRFAGYVEYADRDMPIVDEITQHVTDQRPFILNGMKFIPLDRKKTYSICQPEARIWQGANTIGVK